MSPQGFSDLKFILNLCLVTRLDVPGERERVESSVAVHILDTRVGLK